MIKNIRQLMADFTFESFLECQQHDKMLKESQYGSPVEFYLHERLIIFTHTKTKIHPQFECPRKYGFPYRIDFVLEYNGFKLGLECDGEKFHNPEKDEPRDIFILKNKYVDEIIRIPAKHVFNDVEAILYLISMVHPEVFGKIGRVRLKNCAPEELVSWNEDRHLCRPLDYPVVSTRLYENEVEEIDDIAEEDRPTYRIEFTRKQLKDFIP